MAAAPSRKGWINLWLSILARTGVVGLMLDSVVITEPDAGLAGIYFQAGIYFHRYCTVYDVCLKQNT